MRSSLIVSLAALALLAVSAGAGAEEDQDRHFTWHPAMLITLVGDDDPYLEDGDDGAIGGWISPRLELGYRAESYELGADLGADLRGYADESSLSEAFGRIRVFGEAGILPGLSVRFSEAYAPQPETIAAPGDATHNLVQTNQVDAEVRYWRELPGKREMLLTLRGSHFDGDRFDAAILTDRGGVAFEDDFNPDHWEGAANLELQTPFGDRTSLYARSQFRYRSFSESEVKDHAEITVMAGARTRRFRNIELDLAAGWGLISFESRDNVQRFVGEGSLRYRLPSGWSWQVSAANRFISDLSGNNFVETTGRMSIQKYFGDLTSGSIAVFVSRLENDAWGTDENLFGGAEVRVHRQVARHAEISLTYRYWDNGGDYSFDDFSQNRVALEFWYRR
jgi:hypothetical protein